MAKRGNSQENQAHEANSRWAGVIQSEWQLGESNVLCVYEKA